MDEDNADFLLGQSLCMNLIPFLDKQGVSVEAKLATCCALATHYMNEKGLSNAEALIMFLGILERREIDDFC